LIQEAAYIGLNWRLRVNNDLLEGAIPSFNAVNDDAAGDAGADMIAGSAMTPPQIPPEKVRTDKRPKSAKVKPIIRLVRGIFHLRVH